MEKKYDETLYNIIHFYTDKIAADPEGILDQVKQELQSQWVRLGNDWTGRGGRNGIYHTHGNHISLRHCQSLMPAKTREQQPSQGEQIE
ncbi:MAG: hypothetical protein ABIJ50_09585 [Pseudomonadota bacterium]